MMLSIFIQPTEVEYVKSMAKKAEIGGASNVRPADERQAKLSTDQLVGQLGEYALSIYLFGSPDHYYTQRLSSNLNPKIGDAGQDILGLNIDVKTSLRKGATPLHAYHLVVRPKEMYPNHVYVLAVAESIGKGEGAIVHMIGWAESEQFGQPETEGPFSGAHVLDLSKLRPVMPLQWNWRNYG